jgi:hypothetical protein
MDSKTNVNGVDEGHLPQWVFIGDCRWLNHPKFFDCREGSLICSPCCAPKNIAAHRSKRVRMNCPNLGEGVENLRCCAGLPCMGRDTSEFKFHKIWENSSQRAHEPGPPLACNREGDYTQQGSAINKGHHQLNVDESWTQVLPPAMLRSGLQPPSLAPPAYH